MVIDASVWVSSFVEQDVYHRESRQWLEIQVARDETLMIPTLVLPEVAGAIARRTGDSNLGYRSVEMISRLPGIRLIALNPTLGRRAARLASQYHLRGADAVYVAVAELMSAALVTLDQELHSRTGSHITVVRP